MMWISQLEGGPKRVNHAAVAVGHLIYSFGGYCSGINSREFTSMDVHVLNTATFRWYKHPVSDLPYFENDEILPFKRYGHTAVVYENEIYIWGGRNDRGSDGVLFCFDTTFSMWTAPATSGNIPSARDGHTACLWKHFMIIYGGYEAESASFVGSLYSLDLKKMIWSYIRVEGDEPDLRDFHTAVCLNNRMYLFGGRSTGSDGEEIYSNELWYLDLLTNRWIRPTVSGSIPTGRRSHSSFIYHDKLYIFGGYNALEGKHYNDLHEFDPKTNRWKSLNVGGHKPCQRRRQACALVGDRLFLFGGTSPQLMYPVLSQDRLVDHSDMYVLDFKPSLKTLCLMAVNKYKLDDSGLPTVLRTALSNMYSQNKITVSRPSNSAG